MNSIGFQLSKFDKQVGPQFDWLTWDDLVDVAESDIEFCHNYVEQYPKVHPCGLFLHSKISGNGKTSLAVLTVKDLIRAGKTDRFSMFVEFDFLIKEIAYYAAKQAPLRMLPTVNRMTTADLIILDDVGVEKMTAAVSRHMYSLMNTLWRLKSYVLFTSKFTIEELIGRAEPEVETELLESIASRIQGMTTFRQLSMKTDHRVTRGRRGKSLSS